MVTDYLKLIIVYSTTLRNSFSVYTDRINHAIPVYHLTYIT